MRYQTLPTAEVTPSPMDAVGLTKRELFAAMAMQGMMLYQTPDGQQPHARAIATWAVQQADALIEALNEGKEKP